jgi:hypothetical protein
MSQPGAKRGQGRVVESTMVGVHLADGGAHPIWHDQPAQPSREYAIGLGQNGPRRGARLPRVHRPETEQTRPHIDEVHR